MPMISLMLKTVFNDKMSKKIRFENVQKIK